MSTIRFPNAVRAWTKKKAASYGSVIADAEAACWVRTRWRGERTVPKGNFQYGSQTGAGHEYRGEVRLNNGWDVRVQRTLDLTADDLSFLAAFGLGSVSTADAGGGYYRHTYKPLDISSNAPQLPDFNEVEHYPDEGLKQKILGLVMDEFSISGSRTQWCQATASAIGNGKVDTSTSLSIPNLTTATPLRFTSMSALSATVSGSVNFISRVRSFNWSWQNNCLADDGYLAGATTWNGGPLRSRCELGNRMDSGVLELVVDGQRSATAELTALLASTAWTDVTLTLLGAGSEEVKLVIPSAYLDDEEDGWDDQTGTRTLRIVPIYNASLGAPLKVEAVTTQSTMLAAAA